jgi:hypothetical protein
VAPSSADIPPISPLGKLLSLLGLFAAALYFTGWIYRWAYFSFFQIQVTSLNLPTESFFLATFQVFLGHPLAILRTVTALVFIPLVCLLGVSLWQKLTKQISRRVPSRWRVAPTAPLKFLADLGDELIIVLVTLTTLFWLARWQANADAWLDAVHETSSLPVVTVVFAADDAALGRQLDDIFVDPDGLRVIGDPGLYNRLLGQELTNVEDPDQPRVWRLLLSKDGVSYIFPTLPRKDRFLRPPVLVIQSSDSKLTILSPRVSD